MKNVAVLSLILAAALTLSALAVPLQAPQAGMRLIQTGPTEAKWLPVEVVEAMMLSEVGFMDITEHPELQPAVAASVATLGTASIPSAPRFASLVNPLLGKLSIDNWKATVQALSAYPTRFYRSSTGTTSANWLADQYRAIAAGRSDVSVRTFAHANYQQPSVIARLEGDGSSQEVVILGGHLDSISSGSTAPGADDDASGSSTVLEVFRVLVQNGYKPKRPVEFHAYAAEEAGLLGSQDVAADYASRRVAVASMTQFDMTCYPGTRGTKSIGMTNDFTDAALTTFLKALVDTYTTATYATSTCGYGCSDHASFNKYGYRAAFPFEAPFGQHNPDIHTVRDTLDKCDLGVANNFLKLALSYAVEMSAATD